MTFALKIHWTFALYSCEPVNGIISFICTKILGMFVVCFKNVWIEHSNIAINC